MQDRLETVARNKGKLGGVLSAFTGKSVLVSLALFIGSGIAWFAHPDKGSILAGLKPAAPATMSLAGSYLAGYLVGWGARRTVKLTSVITGIAVAVIGLFAFLGWDSSGAESWVNAASGWIGESAKGAGRYLFALLPSATAAGVGGGSRFSPKIKLLNLPASQILQS